MKLSVFLKSTAIIVIILVVFGLAAFGLNFYTKPLIDSHNAGAELAPLLEVMPEGAQFGADALVYDSENASASTLKDVPASVTKVYKEATGLGYVIRCQATSKYSTAPMVITVGVSADGKICGIQINEYHDSLDAAYNITTKAPEYITSFVGKDSALADIGLVSGSTFSSQAFKSAVEEAMSVLIANDLIAAGVKSDDQIISELLVKLHKGIAPEGIIKATEIAASGNIVKGWKSLNGTGSAYMMSKDGASYLAIVNAASYVKIYDTAENDVTSAHADLASEALAASGIDYKIGGGLKNKIKNFNKDFSDEAVNSAELINFTTFNTVAVAARFTVNGETVYLIQTKPLTYGDSVMTVYTFLDADGAILKQDVSTLIYDHYSVDGYMSNKDEAFQSWLDKYTGKTDGTLSDDLLISGATLSSTAVKNATADVFATLNSIKGGEQ